MRIVRVEVERLALELKEPYTIAYETVSSIDNLLVRLITDGPHIGLGVAAPDPGVTGETPDQAVASATSLDLEGQDPLRWMAILASLPPTMGPSVRAAVDQALLDLRGKVAGLPAWRLLGGYRNRIRTSVTLFIEPPDEVVRRARERVAEGFSALKLKGGDALEADVERLIRVREAVGPDVTLFFDANQGYDAATALALFERVRDVGLAIFEQPTPAAEHAAMFQLASQLPLPVMADESLLTLPDALLLARGDVADMMNLKLAKVGGLDAAALINGVARAAGFEVMVGCTDECALSIAAGLAFALSRPNVEYADLDGHLDLAVDPTAGCVGLEDGMLVPSEEPGFGCSL
jgi:L-alanine-DL-glutamate epimerase-like enolase superfamily enzyme